MTDVSYIILEFGTMGQRNNKRSGKRCIDEVQKVIKGQILVMLSQRLIKYHDLLCIKRKKNTGSKGSGKVDTILTCESVV